MRETFLLLAGGMKKEKAQKAADFQRRFHLAGRSI